MKAFNKLCAIILCLCGAMSVTSCINGDDNYGLDPAVEAQYRQSISGSYNGNTGGDWQLENKIYFYNDTLEGKTVAEKTDSVMNVVARFNTDSTFIISNVPGRVLAKEFPDQYSDMKKAIEEGPANIINGYYIINNVGQGGANLFVGGTVTIPSLTYGGAVHNDISIVFLQALGQFGYVSGHKALIVPMYVGSVYEGDTKLFDVSTLGSSDLDLAKALLQVYVTR